VDRKQRKEHGSCQHCRKSLAKKHPDELPLTKKKSLEVKKAGVPDQDSNEKNKKTNSKHNKKEKNGGGLRPQQK